MNNKTALITGVNGQDGAYLSQLLLEKGHTVVGTYRHARPDLWRLEKLGILEHSNLNLVHHDLAKLDKNLGLIQEHHPDEIYNLAAISSLASAENNPYQTSLVNALAPVSFLDAIYQTDKSIRFFQASSAEIFGDNRNQGQTEETALSPANCYAHSKAYSHKMVELYRTKHGLFACNGILYNHESPLRSHEFVSRKITSGLASLSAKTGSYIEIGNLDARRDWGHAMDYVKAMTLSLEAETPDSYIISTGKLESVRTFVSLACSSMGVKIRWEGSGLDEVGINTETDNVIVKVNPKYYRDESTQLAESKPVKAYRELSWKAQHGLKELCESMMSDDLG